MFEIRAATRIYTTPRPPRGGRMPHAWSAHVVPAHNAHFPVRRSGNARTSFAIAAHTLHTGAFLAYVLVPFLTACLNRKCAYRYICGWAWIEGSDPARVEPNLVSLQVMVAGASVFFFSQYQIQLRLLNTLPGLRARNIVRLVVSTLAFASWFLFSATVYGEPTVFTRNAHKYGSAVASFLTWIFYTDAFAEESSIARVNRAGSIVAFLAGALLVVLGELSFGWLFVPPSALVLFALSFPRVRAYARAVSFAFSVACVLLISHLAGCFPRSCTSVHNEIYLVLQLSLLLCMYALGTLAVESL